MSLPVGVWWLGFVSLLTDVSSEMIVPLLPGLLASLGAGPAALGLYEGMANGLAATVQALAGARSDRSRRLRPWVVGGYGLAATARPLLALAAAPWQVLALRLVDRTGKGLRSAPRDAWLGGLVEEGDRGRAYGLHRAMDHTGATVGPLVAGALLAAGASLQTVLWLSIVPGVLGVLALRQVPDPVREVPEIAQPPAPVPPALRAFLWARLPVSLAAVTDTLVLVRLTELGLPVWAAPVAWAGMHLVRLTAAGWGGWWTDRTEPRAGVALGWGMLPVAAVVLAIATTPWVGLVGAALWGAWLGAAEPAEKALVHGLVPADGLGRGFGRWYLVTGVSAPIAGYVVGRAWEAAGAPTAMALVASLGVLGNLLLLRVRPPSGAATR
jgi:hypothetical protein